MPQRLQSAGITWQVYQEALDEVDDDPMTGNFHCNALAYFKPFAQAPQGSELQRRAMSAGGTARLREDVLNDRLPQVSWIVTPAGYSEHPSYPPAYGAIYVARVLEALTANPKVWGKTVLLLNYDENDGFFDHMVPPQPPTPVQPGISTVSTEGEIHDFINTRAPDALHPGSIALRTRTARADDGHLAVEQRRLCLFRGLRSHVRDPLPRGAIRRQRAEHLAMAPGRLRRSDRSLRLRLLQQPAAHSAQHLRQSRPGLPAGQAAAPRRPRATGDRDRPTGKRCAAARDPYPTRSS